MNYYRYGKVKRYVDNLSKWVRGGVVHYNNAVNMLAKLATFTQVIFTIRFHHFFLLASPLFPVLGILIRRIRMFLGLPDPLIIGMDPKSRSSQKYCLQN
jgi:hypothetical protein